MFKPLWWVDDHPLLFREDQQQEAIDYWQQRERFHRMVINGQIINLSDYYERRDHLKVVAETAARLEAEKAGDNAKMEFMQEAWQENPR